MGWCRRQVGHRRDSAQHQSVARAVGWALKATFGAQGKDRGAGSQADGRLPGRGDPKHQGQAPYLGKVDRPRKGSFIAGA